MIKILGFFLVIILTLAACGPTGDHTKRTYTHTPEPTSRYTEKTMVTKGDTVLSGNTTLHNASYNNLTINGTTNLDTITVANLTVNGLLNIKNSTIHVLTANGKVDLFDTTIKSYCTINGLLTANHSTFHSINLASRKAFFYDSKTKTITVQKSEGYGIPTIELHNNSTVDGDIIFKGENGKVIVTTGSQVRGNVIGGSKKIQ
jgi:hypothetical protein